MYLEINNGTTLILKNVKHIPNIRMNLISIGKLDDKGFCNTLSGGQWKLTKGFMVVARGTKHSSLYLIQAKIYDFVINVVHSDSTTKL